MHEASPSDKPEYPVEMTRIAWTRKRWQTVSPLRMLGRKQSQLYTIPPSATQWYTLDM